MANYNYLKIDFYGQFDNDTIHKLTYPEPYNRANVSATAWLNPIKDYRNNMRTMFPAVTTCYKIHLDSNGVYYSMIFKNADDTRGGYVMITTMISNNYTRLIDGEAILSLLNLLKRKVVDAKSFTPSTVESCLVASGIPQQQAAMPVITPISGAAPSIAYRTFATNDELMDLFQFPRQADYNRFADVFIVPQQQVSQAVPTSATKLTAPIKRTYNVLKPASVQVQGVPETGNQLNVTYTKPGFQPIAIVVPVNGVNNPYASYKKGTITILEPENLPFKQMVSLRVKVNNRSYSDQKVMAQIGSVPLKYANGAYVAELTPAQLAGAEVKMTVDVNDPNWVTKSSEKNNAGEMYYQHNNPYDYRVDDYPVWKKWLFPLLALLAGVAIGVGGLLLWDKYIEDSSEETVTETANSEGDESAFKDNPYYNNGGLYYMKTNDVWNKDTLSYCQAYQDLCDAISDGNVDRFLELAQDYLSAESYNGYVEQIFNFVDSIKDDPTAVDNASSAFVNNSQPSINLKAIRDQLLSRSQGASSNIGSNSAIGNPTNNGHVNQANNRPAPYNNHPAPYNNDNNRHATGKNRPQGNTGNGSNNTTDVANTNHTPKPLKVDPPKVKEYATPRQY